MKRALRFLWETYGVNVLKTELIFIGLILGSNLIFAGNDLFSAYVIAYPMLPVLFAAIFSYSLTALYQTQALGFPCRRKDFFWGSQVMFALTALMAVGLTALLGWALETFVDLSLLVVEFGALEAGIYWARPAALVGLLAVVLLIQPVGAAVGCLYQKHKVIALLIYVLLMVLAVGDVVVSLLTARADAVHLPTWLMPAIYGALGVFAVVGELYFACENRRAIVR